MTTGRDTAGDDPRETAECIEARSLIGSIKRFTVATYEEGLERASSIGTQRGLAFWELGWTRDAPPVDRLREEWTEGGDWEFRVSDLDAWAWQMGRLLGFRD